MRFRHYFSVAAWQYGGLALNVALQFIQTWWLSPEIFGVFAKIQSLAIILGGFAGFSLHTVLLVKPSEKVLASEQNLVHHVFWLSLGQILLLLLLGLGIGSLLGYGNFYTAEESVWIVALLVAGGLLTTKQVLQTLLDKHKHFLLNSQVNFWLQFALFFVSLGWLWLQPTLTALAGRVLLTNFAFFAVYLILAFFYLPYSFRWKYLQINSLRYIFQVASRLYVSRLIETFHSKADILIASYWFDNYQIGLYERIRYYASLPQTLLSSMTNRLNPLQFQQSALSFLHQTNLLVLVFSLLGYLALFLVLCAIQWQWQVAALTSLYPLYLGFWHFAGLFAWADNVRNYLQTHNNIVRTTLKIRLLPLLCFVCLLGGYQWTVGNFSLLVYATLLATAHLSILLAMPRQLLRLQSKRFLKVFYWQWKKQR